MNKREDGELKIIDEGNCPKCDAPKEAWEMTRDDLPEFSGDKKNLMRKWASQYENINKQSLLSFEDMDKLRTPNLYRQSPKQQEYAINKVFKNAHKKLVQQALSEGKPVPAEVLKDYHREAAK